PAGGTLAAALTTDTFAKDEGVPGVGSVQARDARLQTLRQLAHLDLDLTPAAGLPLAAGGGAYVLYERQAFQDPRGEVALVPVDVEDETTATAPQARGARVRDFLAPRLGLRAAPHPALTLLANLSRYAREPNLAELFGTRGVIVGNPRLRPETAFNRDGGFRLTAPPLGPLAHAAFEYAYFDNQIDDLIILVQNSQRIVRPENVTSAAVRGHEVSARGRLWERLGLTANYTHQRARDTGEVTFLRGKQLPGRPADEAFARLELAWSPAHPLPLAPRLW